MTLKPPPRLIPVPEAGVQPPPGDCLLPGETVLWSRLPSFHRGCCPLCLGHCVGPCPLSMALPCPLSGTQAISLPSHAALRAPSTRQRAQISPLGVLHPVTLPRGSHHETGGRGQDMNTRHIKEGRSYWDAKRTKWNQLTPRLLENSLVIDSKSLPLMP